MQQNRDRFDEPLDRIKEKESGPTPNSYKITSNFDNTEKKLIEMSAFMSDSKRDPFNSKGLGPNLRTYLDPSLKKNFHFNIREQWL